jgi:hypothetical protein
MSSSPQDLGSITHYTEHPARYTDSFTLLVKAVMLFGKVTDYNVRGSLRAAAPPSTSQNPFYLDGFQSLDKLVSHDFLASLPHVYKTNQGVGTDNELDTDLYVYFHLVMNTIDDPTDIWFMFCPMGESDGIPLRPVTHNRSALLSLYITRILISSTRIIFPATGVTIQPKPSSIPISCYPVSHWISLASTL